MKLRLRLALTQTLVAAASLVPSAPSKEVTAFDFQIDCRISFAIAPLFDHTTPFAQHSLPAQADIASHTSPYFVLGIFHAPFVHQLNLVHLSSAPQILPTLVPSLSYVQFCFFKQQFFWQLWISSWCSKVEECLQLNFLSPACQFPCRYWNLDSGWLLGAMASDFGPAKCRSPRFKSIICYSFLVDSCRSCNCAEGAVSPPRASWLWYLSFESPSSEQLEHLLAAGWGQASLAVPFCNCFHLRETSWIPCW
mgnify:CR=1 FL=1